MSAEARRRKVERTQAFCAANRVKPIPAGQRAQAEARWATFNRVIVP